jgi:transposase
MTLNFGIVKKDNQRRTFLFAKIQFTTATVKMLNQHWQQALRQGELQLLKRLTALQQLAAKIQPEVIAEQIGVAHSTIYRWLADFMEKGGASLQFRHSPGRPTKLSIAQQHRLAELIEAGPQSNGFRSAIWSGSLVAELIEQEFGVRYKPGYLPQLLAKLGFSYQKARFVSDHLDEAKRAEWLNVRWPEIVAEALAKDALLLFGDEASFAQWGTLGYTWARRGCQPTVKTSGVRKAYKVWGLVDYFSGQFFWQGHTGRFCAEGYCQFLAQVLTQTTRPVILIQDGAPYHTAKVTKQWVADQAERLTVYQLPSYSPDYNPIEHVWRLVKREATHLHYFADFEQLEQTVSAELSSLSLKPTRVKLTIGSEIDRLVFDLFEPAA